MTEFYDPGSYASQVSDGPILGAAEPALHIAAAGYLTTGDLSTGDAGDAGNLTGFSFECWLRFAAYPGATATIAKGPTANPGTPSIQWAMQVTTAGKLIFFDVNSVGTINAVTGATTLTRNAWYHAVGVFDASSGGGVGATILYLNGVQDGSTAGGGTPHPGLVGGSADMRLGGAHAFDIAEAAFYRVQLSATRALAHYQAGAQRGYATQLASARIGAVLDTVTSHEPRAIATSVRSVTPRYMTGQAPVDAVREAVTAESIDAAFFVKADGTLTFLASNHRSSSPYNTSQATFGMGGGAELPYIDLTLDYSESFLFNDWFVTREGSAQVPGTTAEASDTASIARNFKRPQSLTGLPLVADSDSSTIAAAMLAKYKDPMQRVTTLKPNMADAETAFQVFKRELMDEITVKWTPPGGGGALTQVVWIQKIEHTFAPGVPVQTVLAVSPL